MSTTIGLGVKKKKETKNNQELVNAKAKIAELEKENAKYIDEVKNLEDEKKSLEAKIAELEKASK